MHGVLRLIQNELSKILHQKSWKILTVILLVLSVTIPIFSYIISRGYEQHDNFYAEAEEYAQEFEEGSQEREYYLTIASAYNDFADQGYTAGSWKYDWFFFEYEQLMIQIKACQLFIESGDIADISGFFHIDEVEVYWDMQDGKEVLIAAYYVGDDSGYDEPKPVETEFPGEETGDGNGLTPFTREIAEQLLKKKEARAKEIMENELKMTLREFVQLQMKNYEPEYLEAKTAYETAKADYENDKNLLQQYVNAKLIKEGFDIMFDAVNSTDFEKIEDNAQEGIIGILDSMHSAIKYYAEDFAPYSEKQFVENGERAYVRGSRFDDYDDYMAAIELRQEQYFNTLKKHAYSFENNIPLDGSDVRSMTEEYITQNLTLISLIGIFMAAVIMASEHSSGAIRLLTIRPRARWKILLSKLACLGIFLAAWVTVTSLLSTVTTVILYGASDFSIPYLMVSGGEIVEVAALPYLLFKMTVIFLPSFSMICLAFLFSVLIKRAVVSMAIPLIINIFGAGASTLFVGTPCKKFPPLKLTPIPYFNLSNFWCEPELQMNMTHSPLDYGLTLNMGILMFVLYSVIILALSFVIFNKQQIKN